MHWWVTTWSLLQPLWCQSSPGALAFSLYSPDAWKKPWTFLRKCGPAAVFSLAWHLFKVSVGASLLCWADWKIRSWFSRHIGLDFQRSFPFLYVHISDVCMWVCISASMGQGRRKTCTVQWVSVGSCFDVLTWPTLKARLLWAAVRSHGGTGLLHIVQHLMHTDRGVTETFRDCPSVVIICKDLGFYCWQRWAVCASIWGRFSIIAFNAFAGVLFMVLALASW